MEGQPLSVGEHTFVRKLLAYLAALPAKVIEGKPEVIPAGVDTSESSSSLAPVEVEPEPITEQVPGESSSSGSSESSESSAAPSEPSSSSESTSSY